MDSILPHLWARRARAVWDGAAGGDQRLESIKCRAALCRFTGGVAVQEASGEGGTTGLGRDRGREGEGWSASLWPFGCSREPPLPESGLLCDG
jgi:hypothetical protein